jgi:hypothetical protein
MARERTTLGKNGKNGDGKNGQTGAGGGDRKWLSADQRMARDKRIWALRAEGYGFQEIADAEGCGLATVDRAIKRLVKRQPDDLDDDLDTDAVLARYTDGSMRAADARTGQDVKQLNNLEYWRLAICRPSIRRSRRGRLCLRRVGCGLVGIRPGFHQSSGCSSATRWPCPLSVVDW